MDQSIRFDAELIRRYDCSGPRYTSYPTAVEFHPQFEAEAYQRHIDKSNGEGGPLSLYLHLPFCDTVCYYCACNKIVTKNRSRAAPYLARLHREIAMLGRLFDSRRRVEQLHWGGGTPTFISHRQMVELMGVTRQHFNLRSDDGGELSIEVDPREVQPETIGLLHELGFNRLSLGVQDFDPLVQRAVNRFQTEQETFGVMDAARRSGFRSISVDLIYGLPHQTVVRFARTLDRIIEALPDRLSVFNYAHLPERFKTQRQINAEAIPDAKIKLAILETCIDKLVGAGYQYIGMDHFAKPDDELAIAQKEKTLYRNFQGYSTKSGADLYAFGVSAISQFHNIYAQNTKAFKDYLNKIDKGDMAIAIGYRMNNDDIIRRHVIMRLMCDMEITKSEVEEAFGVNFEEYFASSMLKLKTFLEDGLLEIKKDKIAVKGVGRLVIRNIAMSFDAYIDKLMEEKPVFSRTV